MTLQAPYERDEYSEKVTDQLRTPEFGLINEWTLTEWVDGVSIEIRYYPVTGSACSISFFAGATLEHEAFAAAWRMIDQERFTSYFGDSAATLYGVLYGDKVKVTSANYGPETRLRIHDATVDLRELSTLEVENLVVPLGLWAVSVIENAATLIEARDRARNGFASYVAYEDSGRGGPAAGLVGRTNPNLYDGSGKRLQFKLSMKDF